MAAITLVGLGPGHPDQLTRAAWDILSGQGEIHLRTAEHPVVAHLPRPERVHSFDALYDQHATYAEVYAAIVRQVLELARRREGVVYAVPGHPFIGESTTPQIVAQARAEGLTVAVIPGVSFVDVVCSAVALDPLADGLQIADAMAVAARHHPPLEADRPALLAQLSRADLASDVKLTLLELYPADHTVQIVRRAGLPDEQVTALPLHELDRQPAFDSLTTLVIPALAAPASFSSFQEICAHLRAPDGCPWDREQTHLSLRRDLLEETYEVLAALDAEDPRELREELGDLLLHVTMHAQIATEDGEFRFPDVVAAIGNKLIRRHPHVFGDVQTDNMTEILENWEAIKRQERQAKGQTEESLLDGVPKALPALVQANTYLERAQRHGLLNGSPDAAAARQLVEALAANAPMTPEALQGGMLALAALALANGVDLEGSLRAGNQAFARRIAAAEAAARQQGKTLLDLTVEERRRIWAAS